jgi:hypothetical protein
LSQCLAALAEYSASAEKHVAEQQVLDFGYEGVKGLDPNAT